MPKWQQLLLLTRNFEHDCRWPQQQGFPRSKPKEWSPLSNTFASTCWELLGTFGGETSWNLQITYGNARSAIRLQLERIAELQSSCERSKAFGELQQKSSNKSECVMTAMETLIVFDFDWSLIDCNSDTWVVDKLGAMERMNAFGNTLPWTELMDTMMTEVHNDGRTIEDIDNCLRMTPIEQEMVSSVKFAAELGCELQIVSDANSHFIKEILEAHGIQQYFSRVHTNPAHVDQNGALRVLPFHPVDKPHGCELCPPNMCKGLILDSIRPASPETLKKRVIYIGDGGGDYCPSLRLGHGDHVLARLGLSLSKRLHANTELVKATVHEWTSARDVERLFRELLPS